MIIAENVRKKLGSTDALDGAYLCVPQGSVYGLVGPNGAGKTTLLRHLSGSCRQDSGTITIAGEPVWENPSLKERIVFIPDDWYWFGRSSVADMKIFYRDMYHRFSEERFRHLAEAFRLNEKQPIRSMSRGMRKQAAFWLALSAMPDVLLLDEPIDGLDPVMRRQVWSLVLGDVAERGTTVLVSSHNLRELEDVCDHVGIMDHGRTLMEHSLQELQEGTVKVQIAWKEADVVLPEDLPIVHHAQTGRIHTLILRGSRVELEARLMATEPLLCEVLPLSLEEIFIYELGGVGYEVRDIVV